MYVLVRLNQLEQKIDSAIDEAELTNTKLDYVESDINENAITADTHRNK